MFEEIQQRNKWDFGFSLHLYEDSNFVEHGTVQFGKWVSMYRNESKPPSSRQRKMKRPLPYPCAKLQSVKSQKSLIFFLDLRKLVSSNERNIEHYAVLCTLTYDCAECDSTNYKL